MTRVIWKFRLALTDRQDVVMPTGAIPLCAQMQHGAITVWASVDPRSELEPRRFVIVGTGNEGPPFDGLTYLSTVQDRQFVWHVFYQS